MPSSSGSGGARRVAILSDLDGTLIDSKDSVRRAFAWWAELRNLPPDVVDRVPHGRTSTAAAGLLAPHLDAEAEGAILDRRQCADTEGVVPAGVDAGRAAGMTVVAVLTTHRRSELAGAHAYLSELAALPDALRALGFETLDAVG